MEKSKNGVINTLGGKRATSADAKKLEFFFFFEKCIFLNLFLMRKIMTDLFEGPI